MKCLILWIDEKFNSIHDDQIEEWIFIIGYIISSLSLWLGWIWIDPHSPAWLFIACGCMTFGLLGIGSALFPLLVGMLIWELALKWAKGSK